MARALQDAYPAGHVGQPPDYLSDFSPDILRSGHGVITGHLGLLPILYSERPLAYATLIRDPAERAWSHYSYGRWRPGGEKFVPDPSAFGAFVRGPYTEWIVSDYQARWLGLVPTATRPQLLGRGGVLAAPLAISVAELERRARKTIDAAAVVGTAERLPDFVEAMSRLLRRQLHLARGINVTLTKGPIPSDEADYIRRVSPVDVRLHAYADEVLDRALAKLPPLPSIAPERRTLPYTASMADQFVGDGWHARLHTPGAGWHRWTGPDTNSDIKLAVSMSGDARLEVNIVSACDDDAVRSLRVGVQGRSVAHRLEPAAVGVRAIADVRLDGNEGVSIDLAVSHTAPIRGPDGQLGIDAAGLAVGDVHLAPTSGASRPPE